MGYESVRRFFIQNSRKTWTTMAEKLGCHFMAVAKRYEKEFAKELSESTGAGNGDR